MFLSFSLVSDCNGKFSAFIESWAFIFIEGSSFGDFSSMRFGRACHCPKILRAWKSGSKDFRTFFRCRSACLRAALVIVKIITHYPVTSMDIRLASGLGLRYSACCPVFQGFSRIPFSFSTISSPCSPSNCESLLRSASVIF